MRPNNKKSLLILLMSAVLAGCAGNAQEATGPAMPPPAVAVMDVVPHAVPVVREYVGQTMGSREVEIHARVTGIIEHRLYEEGSVVEAGAPLFRIDPKPFEVMEAAAEADLAEASAHLERAERDRSRLESLAAAQAVSRKAIDDARSEVALAAAAVQRAEAALRDARIQLGYTTVTAPISGVTALAKKVEGALVTAGNDSLLTTLVQTDPMDVYFSISENEWLAQQRQRASGELQVPGNSGLDVHIRTADGHRLDRVGHINYAAARIDTTTGTYTVRARFPNPDGLLKAGQFVRVEVSGAERPNAVAVPQKAVLEGPQGKFVFVVERDGSGADVAQIRPVQVGEWVRDQGAEQWIVQSGLASGDRVILDNFVRLQPGAPVTVLDPQADAVAASD